MKAPLLGLTGAVLFLLGGTAPAAEKSAVSTDACRLLTAAEITEVQSGTFVEMKTTTKDAGGFAVSDCFYRVDPFARSVSVEVTGRGAARSGREPVEYWERLFGGERSEKFEGEKTESDARRESADLRGIDREKAPPIPVEGVGDEAFWIGNRASGVLYVLARDRHLYLRVSVGGPGAEEEKRARAADLARKALGRL